MARAYLQMVRRLLWRKEMSALRILQKRVKEMPSQSHRNPEKACPRSLLMLLSKRPAG